MSGFKNPPVFNSVSKPYERYKEELKAWCIITDVAKVKQGVAIALSLPEDDPSGIRDKVFNEVTLENLNKDDGVATLIKYFDSQFQKDALCEVYERFTIFDRYQREPKQKMEDFVLEFEKLYNRIKQKEMELPDPVLGFKILDAAKLSHHDRQLVLTGVDYSKRDSLFAQMKTSLKKFHGEQAIPDSVSVMPDSHVAIKQESVFEAQQNEVYYTNKKGFRPKGAWSTEKPTSSTSWGGVRKRNQYVEPSVNHSSNYQSKNNKEQNPIGFNGKPMRCRICDSVCHLMRYCPHNERNKEQKAYVADAEDIVLYTGHVREDLCLLVKEAKNSAVLDSACTSTVAGTTWMQCFIDTLSPEARSSIKREAGSKIFKFGGGEICKSIESVEFPCKMAGKNVRIRTDVVNADIPLLLSKEAMKKAEVKLDLVSDTAEIFGKEISLDSTTSGHYCIPLQDMSSSLEECMANQVEAQDVPKLMNKIHKQFGHPTLLKMKALLKDAQMWEEEYQVVLDKLYASCEICLKFSKTPSKPVVSLSLAKSFNDVVAMDLKEWRKGTYILYLIDMFSRFTVARWIRNKSPPVIIENMMVMWMGAGLGSPKKFITDNGGEFANREFLDLCENVNVEVCSTAGESPWQNGLCERNHAVVDRCLEKILEDDPKLSKEVALMWAINAKNSLQMWSGFSSYQLVFGQNPNIPSVLTDNAPALHGTSTSEIVSTHLNALHSARRAFIEAESSEKVRRAIRHKIRASSEQFQHGDKVFYKREDSNKWKGPGYVIGQDGKVIFVRHGSFYVRVSPNRLIKMGDEFTLNGENVSECNEKEPINPDYNDKDSPHETQQGDVSREITETDNRMTSDNDSSEEMQEARYEGLPSQEEQTEARQEKQMFPKVKERIKYKLKDEGKWFAAEIIGRAGKRTGKYSAWFNVKDIESGESKSINFELVDDWQRLSEDSERLEEINITSFTDMSMLEAKMKEIDNWKRFNVFDEVIDSGQDKISTTWVGTEKLVNGEKVVKARLVARGFEEYGWIQVDSPTAAKSTFRIVLAIAGMQNWKCKTIDIKSAFLQGKEINREVFIEPPREVKRKGYIWKLNKVVYGLNDAARHWFFTVVEELSKIGFTQSKYDPSLFYWYDEQCLQGLLMMHVDDFIHCGTEVFEKKVVAKLKSAFLVGKEEQESFNYIGLTVKHAQNGIIVSQEQYTKKLQVIPVEKETVQQNKSRLLTENELKSLQTVTGQCNWVASQTRPDISFPVLELSMSCKNATVGHLLQANKVVKRIKTEPHYLQFPRLGSLSDLRLIVYSDASHGNLPDGVSSAGGHVVLLGGKDGNCSPISWSATRLKRVVKSTTAAESLAMLEGLEDAIYQQSILSELLTKGRNKIKIEAHTDSRNLAESIRSTKSSSEKRLRIDIAAMKEMIACKEVESVKWVPTCRQLADGLTKKGAATHKLMNILENGSFN